VAQTGPGWRQRKQRVAGNRELQLAVLPGRLPAPRKRTPKKVNRPCVKEPLSELRSHFTTKQMRRQKQVLPGLDATATVETLIGFILELRCGRVHAPLHHGKIWLDNADCRVSRRPHRADRADFVAWFGERPPRRCNMLPVGRSSSCYAWIRAGRACAHDPERSLKRSADRNSNSFQVLFPSSLLFLGRGF